MCSVREIIKKIPIWKSRIFWNRYFYCSTERSIDPYTIEPRTNKKEYSKVLHAIKENNELFDLFVKNEEYSPLFLDKYQRFPYYLSKYRDIFNPKVSEFLVKKGLRIEYPEKRKFAVCLTHDIDAVRLSRSEVGYFFASALPKRDLGGSVKIGFKLIKNSKLLRNFDDIMNLEEKYDARSSFYFEALQNGDKDFNYNIAELKNELKDISARGWEIGLHGGHAAYNNLEEIKLEKSRLEDVISKKVIGYRNHYLRFETPLTWKLLSEAGFEYDTSFGYNDVVGFRNGMCHPFRPFDMNADAEVNILEVPLNISDVALSEDYMRFGERSSWEITKLLIDRVEKCSGVLTVLWHNNSLFDKKMSRLLSVDACSNKEFFERILRYCSEKKAWITSCEEVCKFWAKHEEFVML